MKGVTIITSKRTVILIVLLLAVVLLYFGYRQDAPPSAEEETAALLKNMGMEAASTSTEQYTSESGEQKPASLPEAGNLDEKLFQEAVKKDLPEKTGLEFFVDYRLERDRMRSRQVEMLQQIVDDPNSVAETRDEAQKLIINITKTMEQEMQLENLIVAKGYDDAAIFIDKDSVTVIVLSPSLAEQDVTRIADLVTRVSGQEMENVVIIPKA